MFKLNLEIWVELYTQHYALDLLFIEEIFKGNIVHLWHSCILNHYKKNGPLQLVHSDLNGPFV